MESLFYRKDKKSAAFKTNMRRLLTNRRFVIQFVVGSAIVLYGIFGSHGILQRVRLEQQKAEYTAKIRQAQEETKRLRAESKALDGDPNAIEKVAREKYGMMREGETVYKVNRK
jgi:cell division protein FtsB